MLSVDFQDLDGNPTSLVNLQTDLMDSDSNGENYMLASVPLRHMVESWGKPDTGVTFKTENAEGKHEERGSLVRGGYTRCCSDFCIKLLPSVAVVW